VHVRGRDPGKGLWSLSSEAGGRRLIAMLAGLLVLLLAADVFLQRIFLEPHRKEQQLEVVLRLGTLRAGLEAAVVRNLLLLQGMAAHIAVMPDEATEGFEAMARELMSAPNALRNMAAAPDFVIRYVYPKEGNEAVLGVDYRQMPAQWPQALQAMETGRMVVAGPVDLLQGGQGLIGRVPVFLEPDQRFWGLVSAALDMDVLLAEAGIPGQDRGLRLAIRGRDGLGTAGEVFLGDAALFEAEAQAVQMNVELPNGVWVMAALPEQGWSTAHPDVWRVRLGLAALFGLLAAFVVFRHLKAQQLRQVKESLARAQAIGGVGSWEWDVPGDRITCSEQTWRILGREPDGAITFEEYLQHVPPEDSEGLRRTAVRALEEGADGFELEHRILRPEGPDAPGAGVVWVSGSASIQRDQQGRAVHVSGTMQDITHSKLAELALQEGEQRFRDLTMLSGDWVWEVDVQGRYTYASGRVKDILGYEPEELLGASPFDIMVAEEVERISTLFATKSREKAPLRDVENWNHAKDGRLVCLLTNAMPVLNEAGELAGYRGVDKDITEARRAGEALRESEERLSLAIEGTNVGLWDWKVQTGETYFNERWARIVGYTLEELAPVSIQTWMGLCHPEDLERSAALLEKHFAGETELYECEARMRHKNGSWVWVLDKGKVVERDESGAPVRMAGTHQDITENRRAQEELERARQHVYDILESTTDAFFEVDAAFNLTYINQKASTALGLKREEHLGANLWQLFPQAVGSRFHEAYIRALREQEVVSLEEYYAPFDTWYEVYAYPTPESLSVYFHDVTDRKLLQEERSNIFMLSLDMICTAGFDGYFRELNPSWERTLGWTRDELLGSPWLDFVHPEDIEATIAAGQQLMRGESVRGFANRYRCKDGAYRWISWNSYPNLERRLIYVVARDVTEDREAGELLRKSEERFRRLVEGAPLGLALADQRGGIEYVNPRFVEMFGYTEAELSDMEALWAAVCPNDVQQSAAERDWRGTVERAHSSGEELPPLERRVFGKSGEEKVVEFRYMPLESEGVILFTDITERKQLEVELTRLATEDPLTGSSNRRQFMHLADRQFGIYMRYARPCAFVMLDIDHFKRINDTWGHQVGDKVLQLFAETCRGVLRESDVFGRLGGEEFAAMLPETGRDEALAVAERLRETVARTPYEKKGLQVPFTVSGGVSFLGPEDATVEEALKRADMALYEAKRSGRNRIRLEAGGPAGQDSAAGGSRTGADT